MPDERPPRAGLNANQFRIKCQTLDQRHRLGPRRQEAVGRPLHEPPLAVYGAKHAPHAAAWFDNRHPTLASTGFPDERVGSCEPGKPCSNHERVRTGYGHGKTKLLSEPAIVVGRP
jgi:hypothetical protein